MCEGLRNNSLNINYRSLSRLGIKIAASTKQGSAHHWKIPRRAPVRDMNKAFNLPYVYDHVTKLRRKQAEVIQNHENEHVRGIGQGEARHRKYKRPKLGGGQAYDRSSDQAAVAA
jgi:hypothetical protein